MKNILILVDVQKGFTSQQQTQEVTAKIQEMLAKHPFDVVIATKFMNYDNSVYERLFNWHSLKSLEEQKLCNDLDSLVDVVVEKDLYTCINNSFIQRLCQLNDGMYPEYVYVAGFDTDCCVLKIATDLFESNVRPIVLTKYCASNGGRDSHEAGIRCMRRLIGDNQLKDVIITGPDDLLGL